MRSPSSRTSPSRSSSAKRASSGAKCVSKLTENSRSTSDFSKTVWQSMRFMIARRSLSSELTRAVCADQLRVDHRAYLIVVELFNLHHFVRSAKAVEYVKKRHA